jgi:glutathione synthase/RimK-type ligase-like ATP-grasp enzyme
VAPECVVTLVGLFEALGLQYAGIDFSVDGAGRLIVFEANAATRRMLVVAHAGGTEPLR